MRPVRVLVAEDNEDHLFLATYALERVQGVQITVVAARDGEEALDHLHGRGAHTDRVLPNLVLLDLSMPRKGGLEVLAEVRGHEALKHIPVVVVTSSDRPEDIGAAYDLGASCYVQKSQGMGPLVDFWATTATLPLS